MHGEPRRRLRRLVPALVVLGSTAALLPAANAATTVLDATVELLGTQPLVSTWEPDGDGSSFDIDDGYQPVDDGSLFAADGTERDDAFDDGLMLRVGSTDYDPENAALDTIGSFFHSPFGQGVRTPARTLENLQVSRIDVVRGKGSATMRSLVKLKNSTNQNRTRDITWESDVGSDGSTAIRRTSSGDTLHRPNDRWIVSSDSATTPADPVVTHVFSGKGAAKKVTTVNSELGVTIGFLDRMSVTLGNVKVPANSTRYLLFFGEMSVSNQAGINAAKKFNSRRKLEPLLEGLSNGVRSKVVNWDL